MEDKSTGDDFLLFIDTLRLAVAQFPHERLGQLLLNATCESSYVGGDYDNMRRIWNADCADLTEALLQKMAADTPAQNNGHDEAL